MPIHQPRFLVDCFEASRAGREEALRRQREQAARTERFKSSVSLASNSLVGRADRYQDQQGVPLSLTRGLVEDAVNLFAGTNDEELLDGETGRAYGLALAQLSERRRLANDLDEAQKGAQQAVEVFERLSAIDPHNIQYLDDLLVALDRLIDTSDLDIAQRAADRALEIAKTLAENTSTPERRLNYSISLSKLAHLVSASDGSRALSLYTDALRVQEDLLQHGEPAAHVRRAAALTRLNIGQIHSSCHEFPIARKWLQASLSDIERLRADHPRATTYVQDEAAAREALGDVLKQEMGFDEALIQYREESWAHKASERYG